MKIAIEWKESIDYRAIVEVSDEHEALTLVKRLEIWGDVPKEVEDAKEEIDYSIADVDWEVEEM
jgi:hypothetical protein